MSLTLSPRRINLAFPLANVHTLNSFSTLSTFKAATIASSLPMTLSVISFPLSTTKYNASFTAPFFEPRSIVNLPSLTRMSFPFRGCCGLFCCDLFCRGLFPLAAKAAVLSQNKQNTHNINRSVDKRAQKFDPCFILQYLLNLGIATTAHALKITKASIPHITL